jgi:hypothetical protein
VTTQFAPFWAVTVYEPLANVFRLYWLSGWFSHPLAGPVQ